MPELLTLRASRRSLSDSRRPRSAGALSAYTRRQTPLFDQAEDLFMWLTERGTMHGYGDLVVDMRGLTEMRAFAPTFMDLTHSLQQPNQASGVTGGRPKLIATVDRGDRAEARRRLRRL